MDLLKTSSDEYFNNLTYLASSISNCPFAVVSFIEGNFVWYKSAYGIQPGVTPREGSFTEAVLKHEGLIIIEDASVHPDFQANVFVKKRGVKFFLGIPLYFENKKIGAFSIGDELKKTLNEKAIENLKVLAKQVEREIERIYTTGRIIASENKYRSVTQAINDAVITCDGKGKIVSWNRAAETIFEFSEKEAIGQSVDIIIPLEFRERHNFGMRDLVAKRGERPSSVLGKTLELVGLKKSGVLFPLELSVSFWMDKDEFMLTAILRDITERKKYLKELSDSNDNLEKKISERTADLKILMESIPEIIWEANSEGFITYMSPKWKLVTGKSHSEGSWSSFLHPDDLNETLANWDRALSSGVTYESEYRLRQADGSYRWTLARAVPQVINGKLTKWFGSLTDIHERKTVNDIQNNFFALPNLMLCLAGPDGYFKKLNSAWENTLGFTVNELMERPFMDFIHPDDVEKTIRESNKLSEGKGSVNFENRYSCKNGEYVWLHWTSVIRDGLYYCVARDITYLKKSEIILKESEIRFKSILEQSPIATQLINTSGGITKVNKAWQELWGVNDSVLPEVVDSYNIHSDPLMDKLQIRSHINEAFKGRAVVVPPILYDPIVLNRPGRKRWVKVYLNPIFRYDGSLSEVLLMFLDITDQKLAETEIRTKQGELQSILDNSPSVMFLKDLKGHYILVNKEFETFFDLKSADVLGKTDLDIFPKVIAERFMENDRFVLENAVAIREEEVAPKADGFHTFFSSKFPILDDEGKVRLLGGISTDITSHKKFEEEKLQFEIREKASHETSKLKSEFLANMSHEIRTPINGVVGMTGLLLDTSLSDEQKDYADQIRRCGETLLTVINDILDFSKIEAGKLDFESIDFDVFELINDSLVTVSFSAKKKGLNLVSNLDHNIPRVLKGDPGRLKQILMNLLSNAVKFTHEGNISLRTSLSEENNDSVRVRFEVKDSGIGITPANIDKLFRPFSQADGSTQRKYGGTGLGLSICKKLVDQWNGQIGVGSVEGEGSLFWFELVLPISTSLQIERSKKSVSSVRKARILVAEDNPVNQMIAVKMLKKMGHYADVAGNGFEALQALRNAPYDLILMDCQMPECDGYEATRILRTSPEFAKKHHIILAMTANAMSGDAEKCIASGMDGYISKPVSLEKLNEIINEWLDKTTI